MSHPSRHHLVNDSSPVSQFFLSRSPFYFQSFSSIFCSQTLLFLCEPKLEGRMLLWCSIFLTDFTVPQQQNAPHFYKYRKFCTVPTSTFPFLPSNYRPLNYSPFPILLLGHSHGFPTNLCQGASVIYTTFWAGILCQ